MGPVQALVPGTSDKVLGTFDGAWLTRLRPGTWYMAAVDLDRMEGRGARQSHSL